MPQIERVEVHLEVRQHLDGLMMAYEELGLSQEEALELALRAFGDPHKIGWRMYWEWRQGQKVKLSERLLALFFAMTAFVAS